MNSLPPFEVYFQEYVCRVQDEQLEAEISYVMRHNGFPKSNHSGRYSDFVHPSI